MRAKLDTFSGAELHAVVENGAEERTADKNIVHTDIIKYMLVSNRDSNEIGKSYVKTHIDEADGSYIFNGVALKLSFSRDSLKDLTEEQKSRLVCDMFYCAYFIGAKSMSLAGIREYYDAFKRALDPRALKKLRQDVMKLTQEHYEVSYNDLRLILLEYNSFAMGMNCELECSKKYGTALRENIVPDIIEKTNYGRFIDFPKLKTIIG